MYKYAECASACYALFDKDEFIESYNFNKVNPDNIDNMSIVIANTYEDFLTKLRSIYTTYLALDFRFRDFPAEINTFHINQLKVKKNDDNFYLKQTKQFLTRYEIKAYQPNTSTGFSATLFYDKVDKECILAMRGTESNNNKLKDYMTDSNLFCKKVVNQYDDMMKFYEYKVKPILHSLTLNERKLIVTWHSLGGALAQYFTISFHNDDAGENQVVKETYTFNSPGIDVQAFKIFGVYVQNPCLNALAPSFIIPGFNVLGPSYISLNLALQAIDSIKRDEKDDVYFNQMMENNLKLDTISTDKYVYHIESCAGLMATTRWLRENTTQHLGTDIKGQYLYVNNNIDISKDSHGYHILSQHFIFMIILCSKVIILIILENLVFKTY